MGEPIIVHRDFAGEHEMSEACWCRPVVMDSDSPRDTEDVIAETERLDG